METLSLKEVSKQVGISTMKILAWEGAGYLSPVFARRGRRFVRRYDSELAAIIGRVVSLVGEGYQLRAAFKIARGETGVSAEAK